MAADYKVPAYTLYFDTSVAHSRKPSEPISGKLRRGIEGAKTRTQVDIRVPDVVIEELTYQQFVIAQAAADNLKKNSQTLKDVCGVELPAFPTPENLKDGARKLMTETINQLFLSRIATPVQRIDWATVIDDSCWRIPPFEKPQSADDLAEKGFRDKIVLETIKFDATKISSGVVAFVCRDNLLRSAFARQVKAKCPVEVYPTFEELVSHLDLLAKAKSDGFAKAVLTKANSAFYDPDDPNCVALSCGVVTHLMNEYSEDMTHPPFFSLGTPKYPSDRTTPAPRFWSTPGPALGNFFEDYSRWTPVSPVKLFASPPVFQATKQDDRYHWVSTVTLAQLLRKNDPQRGQAYALPEERIRTKDVDVSWSCRINPSTAEFSAVSVDGYMPTMRDAFLNADWRSRSAYDLPLLPSSDSAVAWGAGPGS